MEKDFYVVGIGASAGGTEALYDLFSFMPENPKAAFIIVRHIKRDYKTEFSRFLSKYTTLKVKNIKDGERVKPGFIYVLPENEKVSIQNGLLHLYERPEDEKINTAIDDFFYSLGDDAGEKGIAVVLSGYMSDGANGSKYVKSKGGKVFVQDPRSANVSEMPRQAIKADHPNYVMEVKDIAQKLYEIVCKSKDSLVRKEN